MPPMTLTKTAHPGIRVFLPRILRPTPTGSYPRLLVVQRWFLLGLTSRVSLLFLLTFSAAAVCSASIHLQPPTWRATAHGSHYWAPLPLKVARGEQTLMRPFSKERTREVGGCTTMENELRTHRISGGSTVLLAVGVATLKQGPGMNKCTKRNAQQERQQTTLAQSGVT